MMTHNELMNGLLSILNNAQMEVTMARALDEEAEPVERYIPPPGTIIENAKFETVK